LTFSGRPPEVFAIERLHGAGGIGVGISAKPKPRGRPVAIVHERHLSTVPWVARARTVFGGRERQISNIKFRHKNYSQKLNTVTGQALSAGRGIFGVSGAVNTESYRRKNLQAGGDGTGILGRRRQLLREIVREAPASTLSGRRPAAI
jgi:hypothetical protein